MEGEACVGGVDYVEGGVDVVLELGAVGVGVGLWVLVFGLWLGGF